MRPSGHIWSAPCPFQGGITEIRLPGLRRGKQEQPHKAAPPAMADLWGKAAQRKNRESAEEKFMKRQLLACLLSLAMLFSLLPASALAAEADGTDAVPDGSVLASTATSVSISGLPASGIIDIQTVPDEGLSLTCTAKISLSTEEWDAYIWPLLRMWEDGKNASWKENGAWDKVDIFFPSDIFPQSYLEVDWNIAPTLPSVTTGRVLRVRKYDETGVHYAGIVKTINNADNSLPNPEYYKRIPLTVTATLKKEACEMALAQGGSLKISSAATLSVADSGLPDLYFPISYEFNVIDSNAGNLHVTGDPPPITGGVWQLAGGTYAVSGTAGEYERLSVSGDTTLTLSSAAIRHTTTDTALYAPAISIEAGSHVNLILSGDNVVEGSPGCAGIYVAPGATLTISGGGALHVKGGNGGKVGNVTSAGGAGIGGNGIRFVSSGIEAGSTACFGSIVINGGSVTATGGGWGAANTGGGAGIGAGGSTSKSPAVYLETLKGSIEINSGTVRADGGRGDIAGSFSSLTAGGAGIGSGGNTGNFYTQNSAVSVKVNGGTVTAQGWDDGAGIGGGANTDGGVISITGGTVTAIGGYQIENGGQCEYYGGAGIGGGDNGGVTGISITGGMVVAKAVGAAAGIGGGSDRMVGTVDPVTDEVTPGSIHIGGSADVTAYGGSGAGHFNKYGGAGIGAGQSWNIDNGCGTISISGTAIVRAYAGGNAQAIGVGSRYAGADVNTLTIADTVTLWAQTQKNVYPALLDSSIPGTSMLQYGSTNTYLVSNTDADGVASGSLTVPNGVEEEFDYTLAGGKLTIDGEEVPGAAPQDPVANWATLYRVPVEQHTVAFDLNYDGAPELTPQTVEDGSSVEEPDPAPVRAGYDFLGWYAQKEGGAPYDFSSAVAGDLTLYAQWKTAAPPVQPTAAYKVEHYWQQPDGTYILHETESPLYGEVGQTVTAVPKAYAHYRYNPAAPGTELSGEVSGTGVLTLKVFYDPEDCTVAYELSGGAGSADYSPAVVKYGSTVTVKAAPEKSGYTFAGWKGSDGKDYQPGDVLTVLGDITLTARWLINGGGIVTPHYVLHYESNGGTEYRDERYAKDTLVQLNKVPVREGFQFTGWYADQELTERVTSITMTSDKTVYAGWRSITVPDMLNGGDHSAYVIGYEDGTVRPNANISRAEVAAIFFRLLKPEVRDSSLTSSNTFTDVNEGMWCSKAVSTMAALGLIKGRTAETFDPSAFITRAEFAVICARFDAGQAGGSSFNDISGHWAEAEIRRAAALGWIQGYGDGTFRPDAPITRAEAMTVINRVLCRIPENEADLLPGMNVWPDNRPGGWHYLAVQEATNSHEFRYKDGTYEHWTALADDPDWTRYQG